METNPNIVLAEENNLAIKSSFETEEPGKNLILLLSSIKMFFSLKIQRQKIFKLEGHFYIFGFLSIKKNYSKVFSTLIKR
jgi:hypothetical protein